MILERDGKVNLLEFSGNALNHICKNNPEYYEVNWDLDFKINDVLK